MTKKRLPESAAVKKDALDHSIVDGEIKGYLNSEKETMFKKMAWEMMYKDYNQPKPKTLQQKKKPKKKAEKKALGVNGRSEKVEKRSSKINYDALTAFLKENAEAEGGDRRRDEEAGVEGAGLGGREEEGINDNNDDEYDNIHGFEKGIEDYSDDGYGGGGGYVYFNDDEYARGGYGDDDYGEYDDY